jgi:hypothetical protein
MARYFIRRNKPTNECDVVGADYPIDINFNIGMGPVNPMGGPDKFDVIIPKINRKTRKLKRKRK